MNRKWFEFWFYASLVFFVVFLIFSFSADNTKDIVINCTMSLVWFINSVFYENKIIPKFYELHVSYYYEKDGGTGFGSCHVQAGYKYLIDDIEEEISKTTGKKVVILNIIDITGRA